MFNRITHLPILIFLSIFLTLIISVVANAQKAEFIEITAGNNQEGPVSTELSADFEVK
ncbi:hypothetical protein JT359_14455 [Candidatus Poribacteria bacterium]|nr:hypothetical protein [Candidatus Poribacteria bacterium]